MVVVAVLSQALGWPLLGPYAPYARLLTPEAQNAANPKVVIAELQKQEEAARAGLMQEMALLREENLRLKEDLASLRNLKGAGPAGDTVRLSNFIVRAGADPEQYDWRLLITIPRDSKAFQGRVLVRLQYPSGEKIDAPSHYGNMPDKEGTLQFKYTQTLEGSFRNTQSMKPSQVIAEIWKNGDVSPIASIATPLQR